MACKVRAQSSTVRERGPMVSMDHMPGLRPCRLTRPQVGLRPTTPHQAAGPRTEPPVSSPREVAHMQAAVAPPEPLLEPPGKRSRSQGVRAVANAWDKLVVPNSVMLSLPRRMAPADFSLAITVAYSSGTKSLKMGVPQVVRMPAVLSWSLIATGTPCNGPRYAPRASSRSDARAASIAWSRHTVK